jgi:multisubunit Na+/H+ antiporter MnhG subunit
MKAVLLFVFILIMMSSCGYRIGTHSTKTNLTAWKAEKEAKREEDKKYLKH